MKLHRTRSPVAIALFLAAATLASAGFAQIIDLDRTRNEAGGHRAGSPRTSPSPCHLLSGDTSQADSRVNIVFVSSGYDGDMQAFEDDVRWIWGNFDDYTPLRASEQLNVLFVTKENPDINCYLNCQGVARLLCCDVSVAKQLSAECFQIPRQTVIVHNDLTYGGSGYITSDVATTTVHPAAPRVAVHELGHSLFNLGDEYDYQTHSNPLNSENCDFSDCSKWSEMLGWNGVSCEPGSCAQGAYFTSEYTIMRNLGYPFEEVNERIGCCIYLFATGSFPTYCSQYAPFSPSGDLAQYCTGEDPFSAATTVPRAFMTQPFAYSFVRSSDTGEWVLESRTALRPGWYANEDQDPDGSLALTFVDGGLVRELRFPGTENVEYPLDVDQMGGTVRVPRTTLTVIVDHAVSRPAAMTLRDPTGTVRER